MIFALLLTLTAVFLILLVLVQRGRGGGLAGALGGMGGSSAFGAKAGDTFTYITYAAACVWILLCIAAFRFGRSYESRITGEDLGESSATLDVDKRPDDKVPAPDPDADAAKASAPADADKSSSSATPPAEPTPPAK